MTFKFQIFKNIKMKVRTHTVDGMVRGDRTRNHFCLPYM